MDRRVAVAMLAFAASTLGGCQSEPDFDSKFEAKQQALQAKGKTIESSVDAQLQAARDAQAAQAEAQAEKRASGHPDKPSSLDEPPRDPSLLR